MNFIKALYLVCIVFCGLSWTVIRAMAGEGVVIVKILDRQADTDEGVVLDELTFSVGSLPVKRLKSNSKSTPYELQVLNSLGEIIYVQQFDFIRSIEVPLPEPESETKGEPSRISLKEPEAVLVIPYLPEGVKIRVRGPNKTTLPTPIPAIPELYKSLKSWQPSPAPAQEGNLYILLIASGFSNMSDFQIKAQETKEYLHSKEPFASQVANVLISTYENEADLGCYSGCYGIDRLMCCDSTKVMTAAVASGQLYDEIIIIHNTQTYSGGGSRDLGTYQTNSASTYCQVYNGDYTSPMALHEFGHSFGNLCDEYTYGSEGYSYYDCANCRASCSGWSDVSTACQLGCDARSDYYRPEDSIMLSYETTNFNLPSIHNSLVPRLTYFIPTFSLSETFVPVSIFQLLLEKRQ